MIVVNDEQYEFELYPRVQNSAFVREDHPSVYFKGRPANDLEKKSYRIQAGVQGGTDSVYIICSNLPASVEISDQIKYLGKIWTVVSVGYYFRNSNITNPRLMSDEYLAKQCPKGIVIG